MRRLPILTFHAIGDGGSTIDFPSEVLARGLRALCRRGWQTIDLVVAVDQLRKGLSLPPRAFVMTFDDGYESVYRHAFPVLRDLGLTATLFVTVGAVDDLKATVQRSRRFQGRNMLSWEELAEMLGAGFAVGAHTLTHPDLTALPSSQVISEMAGSRDRLEDKLGVGVKSFAYPFGRYDAQVREHALQLFELACSDRLGYASPRSDPFALERIETYYLRRQSLFDLLATPWIHGYLALRSGPRLLRRIIAPVLGSRREKLAA